MPLAPSTSITALSAAAKVLYVSSEKSWCPGVSKRLIWTPPYSNVRAVEVMEIPEQNVGDGHASADHMDIHGLLCMHASPLCFSSSIQSDVALFAARRALTSPASWIAPPYSKSFSV